MDTSVKFREWAAKGKYRLDSDEHGYYINTHTQSAWDAWRASEELWKTLINFGQSTQEK
jgi:hypothetical protein